MGEPPKDIQIQQDFLVPHEIDQLDLYANMHYPQMFGAKDLLVGAKVLQLILEGKMTLKEFNASKLSSEQVSTRLEAVNRAHKAHAIDNSSEERMRSLWGLEKIGVNEVFEKMVDVFEPKSLKGKNTEERGIFMDNYLHDPKNKVKLDGLLVVWQAGAEALQTEESMIFAKEYRHSLRGYAVDTLKEKNQNEGEVREYWKGFSEKFSGLVKDGVFGVETPLSVNEKNAFLEEISFKVVARLPQEKNDYV